MSTFNTRTPPQPGDITGSTSPGTDNYYIADWAAYNPETDDLVLSEVKNGKRADLNTNQKFCLEQIQKGNYELTGDNAKNLGITAKKPVQNIKIIVEAVGGSKARWPRGRIIQRLGAIGAVFGPIITIIEGGNPFEIPTPPGMETEVKSR